jgi:hypothetical protein
MHSVAGGTRCWPGRRGCLRLTEYLLHWLLLWNSMVATFPDAPQQEVNQGQHDEKKQQKDMPNPQVSHSGLA